MKQLITSLVTALLLISAKAQVKMGENARTVHPGAVLELESTSKGLRMPQVALTNTTTWAPLGGSGTDVSARGMAVYNTNAALASTNASYPPNGVGEYYWDGTGWVNKNSSNTQSSLVFFSVLRTAYQNATDGAYVVCDFTAKEYDKNNSFNLTTNSITIPANAGGFYQINGSIVTTAQPAGQGGYLSLFVNNIFRRFILVGNAAGGAGIAANGTIAVMLNPGDVVNIRYLANTAGQQFDPQVDMYQLSR